MPNDLDELSLIAEDGAPRTNGKSAELYDQEVQQYEQASAKDPDPVFDKKLRLAYHERELKQIDALISARTEYAQKIFGLLAKWLIGVGVVIVLQGFHVGPHGGGAWLPFGSFNLSDKVILALIGGTTLNVIGIFTIVANFLFPKKGSALLMKKMKAMRKTGKSTEIASKPAQKTSRAPRKPKAAAPATSTSTEA